MTLNTVHFMTIEELERKLGELAQQPRTERKDIEKVLELMEKNFGLKCRAGGKHSFVISHELLKIDELIMYYKLYPKKDINHMGESTIPLRSGRETIQTYMKILYKIFQLLRDAKEKEML